MATCAALAAYAGVAIPIWAWIALLIFALMAWALCWLDGDE